MSQISTNHIKIDHNKNNVTDTDKIKPPFFIIGNPRSGTTLLRLMMNNHEEMVVPPECGFAVWFLSDFAEWGRGKSKKKWINKFITKVSSARKIETWKIDFEELRRFLYKQSPESYAEAVSLVYIFYAARTAGKRILRWGDKNNFHIDYIDEIDQLFNECKFIHIIRDGRDVASSYMRINKKNIKSKYAPDLPCEIKKIAEQWSSNVKKIKNRLDKTRDERVHEVKYEKLVSSPSKVLENICEFLGQEYSNEMLGYHQKNREEEQEPEKFLQWKRKTLEPPSDDRVGVYQEALTQNEKAEFNQIAASILEEYDYI